MKWVVRQVIRDNLLRKLMHNYYMYVYADANDFFFFQKCVRVEPRTIKVVVLHKL